MIRGTMRAWYAVCYPAERHPRLVTPELARVARVARGAPDGTLVLSCLVHRDDAPPPLRGDGHDWSPWYTVRGGKMHRVDLGSPDAPLARTGNA